MQLKFIYSEKAKLFVLCTASQIIDGDFAKLCGLHIVVVVVMIMGLFGGLVGD